MMLILSEELVKIQEDLLVDCEKEAGSNLRGLPLLMSIRLLLLEYTKYYKRHFGVWDIQRFSERNYYLRLRHSILPSPPLAGCFQSKRPLSADSVTSIAGSKPAHCCANDAKL
jgi:hypothetical protein